MSNAQYLARRRACAMPDLGRACKPGLPVALKSINEALTAGRTTNALPGGRCRQWSLGPMARTLATMAQARRLFGLSYVSASLRAGKAI